MTTARPGESRPVSPLRHMSRLWTGRLAVLTGYALVVECVKAGEYLDRNGFHLHIGDAWPLAGHWQDRTGRWTILLVVLALGYVWAAPRFASWARWRFLLPAGFAIGAAWPIMVALIDGPRALTAPLRDVHEYLYEVPRVTDLTTFWSGFTDHIIDRPEWTTHVGGHPPGMLFGLTVMDRIGLGGAEWYAALCLVTGAAAVPAVIATTRLLGGDPLARRAAPFVALSPAALWIATSSDAFFAGVGAIGICALAHSAARHDRRGDVLALLGGLALAGCLYLSYGLVLLGPLALAVVAVQRRWRPLLLAAVPVVGLFVAGLLAGFNWFEGLALSSQRVHNGDAWNERPGLYFGFAAVATVLISAGPAVFAAAGWLRRNRFAVLPGAVTLAMLVAIGSGLSVGETERIYLPFVLWLLPVSGLLPEG
ncbi:MAG: hypothetical protein ACRD0P_24315, partial [Stackebrandtia sp.]